jgi:hypothetical protein
MSEVKHTRGPWTFSYYGFNGYCITTVGGTHLATSILYKRDGGEANARLIATAPEMYEYIASCASNGCAEAKRLIAKAEGGSHG